MVVCLCVCVVYSDAFLSIFLSRSAVRPPRVYTIQLATEINDPPIEQFSRHYRRSIRCALTALLRVRCPSLILILMPVSL